MFTNLPFCMLWKEKWSQIVTVRLRFVFHHSEQLHVKYVSSLVPNTCTHLSLQSPSDDDFIIGVHQEPASCLPLIRFKVIRCQKIHSWGNQNPSTSFFLCQNPVFQASGENNLKIHLKFPQDPAFSFHISMSSMSQNSMSFKSWYWILLHNAKSFKTTWHMWVAYTGWGGEENVVLFEGVQEIG